MDAPRKTDPPGPRATLPEGLRIALFVVGFAAMSIAAYLLLHAARG